MPGADALFAQAMTTEIPWQIVVGVFVLTTAAVIQVRRRAVRRAVETKTTGRARRRPISIGADEDLQALARQIEQLAREVTAQVDTRFRKLDVLLREADKRIERLSDGTPSPVDVHAGLDLTVGDAGVEEHIEGRTPSENASGAGDVRRLASAYAAQGLTTEEIASRLARSGSEIELMLHLDSSADPSGGGAEQVPPG